MHITCIQLDSVWEDKVASFARAEALLAKDPPPRGALVILPEMFATGFSLDVTKTAEPPDGCTMRWLAGVARSCGCHLLAGLVLQESGHYSNAAVTLSPTGEVVAIYRKQRPFTGLGEDVVHTAGRECVRYTVCGASVAPLVCYDLRFPELARSAALAGAEILVFIAAWPLARIAHWVALLQARAIENQAIVVGVNRTGSEPRLNYCGRSMVIGPQGEILDDAGEKEGVLHCELDVTAVREWRSIFPALRDATPA